MRLALALLIILAVGILTGFASSRATVLLTVRTPTHQTYQQTGLINSISYNRGVLTLDYVGGTISCPGGPPYVLQPQNHISTATH